MRLHERVHRSPFGFVEDGEALLEVPPQQLVPHLPKLDLTLPQNGVVTAAVDDRPSLVEAWRRFVRAGQHHGHSPLGMAIHGFGGRTSFPDDLIAWPEKRIAIGSSAIASAEAVFKL